MSDASHALQSETIVMDDPDDTWRPARELEEVDVQIRGDDGLWHRIATLANTACGEVINLRLQQEQRRQRYEGHLCGPKSDGTDGCYSAFELALTKTTNDALAAEPPATSPLHVTGDLDRKIAEWLTAPSPSKPPRRKR